MRFSLVAAALCLPSIAAATRLPPEVKSGRLPPEVKGDRHPPEVKSGRLPPEVKGDRLPPETKGSSPFSRRDVSIAEAPTAHQLALTSHPNPSSVRGPRAKWADRKKCPWPPKKHHSGYETVNTIFSGVYPVLNVTWGSKQAANGNWKGNGYDPHGQQFISFIDTGSSDTWVAADDLHCLDIETRAPLPQSACGFDPLWNSRVGAFQNLTDLQFSIGYFPENETLQGDFGLAPISVGGLTVPKQEVAIVREAAWSGDDNSSGLLGLAYPSLTSAYTRANDTPVNYDPLFTSMVKQKVVDDAVFTIALNRVPQGTSPHAPAGLIAFGGLVPASYYTGKFTSVPIEETVGAAGELTWYSTTHELVYTLRNGTRVSGGKYQSIVDSGTAPNFVPTAAAYNLNAQFEPPAVYNETLGYWTVDCKAKAPYAAFIIGGVEMPMDPREMIVRSLNGLLGYEDVCFSAFADGGDPSSSMIIGEVWQLSYVVAYDQGRKMIHFAKRSSY